MMKKLYLLMLVFSFALVGSVIATECGSAPTDGCEVTESTTFNNFFYDLPNGITINADNIILDCANSILSGPSDGSNVGITIGYGFGDGITIKNCFIQDYFSGIDTIGGNGATIGSTFTNSVIKNSLFELNGHGIRIFTADSPLNDPVLIPTNNFIQDNTFLNNMHGGVLIAYGDTNVIKGNIFDFTDAPGPLWGLRIENGVNNIVGVEGDENIIKFVNGKGIDFAGQFSSNNLISYNQIENNGVGVEINTELAGSNIVEINQFDGNGVGVNLKDADDTTIRENNIMNSGTGMVVGFGPGNPTSNNNLVYRNNFMNSIVSAQDYSSTNSWNDSVSGNYWDDYDNELDGCTDGDYNNFCDNPYNVNAGAGNSADGVGITALDYLPQVGQFSSVPPPILNFVSDLSFDEGQSGVINVIADSILGLTYSITNPNFIVNDNILTWQTNFDDADTYGSQTETVIVTDENNLKTVQEITVTVNDVFDTECSTEVRNSCTVSVDTTFTTTQSYNFKDGINIIGDGVTLDCVGSSFDGSGFGIVNTGVDFSGRTGSSMSNCNFDNYDVGVDMVGTSGSTLNGVKFNNNRIGVNLDGSIGNFILNGEFRFNERGLDMLNSNGNIIDNNMITNNDAADAYGLFLQGSSNNAFTGNEISDNYNGILIRSSSNTNTVNENNIQDNVNRGLRIQSSSNGNIIYDNNFINNGEVSSTVSANDWYFNSEGNYWDSFNEDSQGCFDNDYDGLCDNAYTQFNIQDNFPLRDSYGWINKWPIITSVPASTANIGIYNYDVDAIDPDGDSMQYSLVNGPSGMEINQDTGLVSWQTLDVGRYRVIVSVDDGNGGSDTQSYPLGIECQVEVIYSRSGAPINPICSLAKL